MSDLSARVHTYYVRFGRASRTCTLQHHTRNSAKSLLLSIPILLMKPTMKANRLTEDSLWRRHEKGPKQPPTHLCWLKPLLELGCQGIPADIIRPLNLVGLERLSAPARDTENLLRA